MDGCAAEHDLFTPEDRRADRGPKEFADEGEQGGGNAIASGNVVEAEQGQSSGFADSSAGHRKWNRANEHDRWKGPGNLAPIKILLCDGGQAEGNHGA